jgi:hypothetical protein
MGKWLFCPAAEHGATNRNAFRAFPKTPKMAFNFTFGEDSAKAEHPNGWRPMVTCSNTALSD